MDRIQFQLVLPYKLEPRRNPTIRRHLDDGYRIERLQRISDREVVVVLTRGADERASA